MSAATITSQLESLRQRHYYSEDCWYSCPKSAGGCCDPEESKDRCNCGADAHNERLDYLARWVALYQDVADAVSDALRTPPLDEVDIGAMRRALDALEAME